MADTLEQIDQRLGYLSQQAPGIVGRATLAGAKAMVPAMRSAAGSQIGRNLKGKSISTGNMVRSINAGRVKKTGELIGSKAGIDVGKSKGSKGSGHHGHLFIGGTVKRETGSVRVRSRGVTIGRKLTGKPVQNRGIMPAHASFVVEGASAAKGAMEAAFVASLQSGIAAALDKGV